MDRFHREVVSIENEAKTFIDDSFKTLRSAEGQDQIYIFSYKLLI